MTLARNVSDYLRKCRLEVAPSLISGSDSFRNLSQVVVIPALAEKRHLFKTLASLARNDPKELERTLIICVINNRPFPFVSGEALQNNQETLAILEDLTAGRRPSAEKNNADSRESFREILQSRLRLAYLDASSAGQGMPVKQGGVGLARKMGLDAGLAVMDHEKSGDGRLLCLDADSPVAENYFSAIRQFYESHNSDAAVVSYAHPFPDDPLLLAAICNYEIFLRYYVLGLNYAESPYAFHTVGSTMSCTARGYVAVRGMNRREAGEDFYFLNKLAKLSPMGKITRTRVYPSSRPSRRVPFGTGRRMSDCLEGRDRKDVFYDPRVFSFLKKWQKEMRDCIAEGGNFMLKLAGDISPHLVFFLEAVNFPSAWDRICRTHKNPEKRAWHFQEWFDAFQTLKLIHYLTKVSCPAVELWQAVPILLEWAEQPVPESLRVFHSGNSPGLAEHIELLQHLRDIEQG